MKSDSFLSKYHLKHFLSVNLKLGDSNDAQILHTGTNFNLVNDTGSIFIQNDATANPDANIYIRAKGGENSIVCADDAQVELYNDNDRKFRTIASGAQVESTTGDTQLIVLAEEDDSGADALITARVTNDSASSYVMFGDSSDANIGKIRYNHSVNDMLFYTSDTEKWRITSGGNLQNNSDSGKLQLGTSEDLEIYHNGSHSFIDDSGTGNLYIRSGTDNAITLNTDADIILYYDNSIKFQTTNDGTKTTGIGTFTSHVSLPDNAALCLGNRISGTTLGDLRLYHNGSHSYIDEVGTGNLYIRNGTDNAIWCETDGKVQLYYDNSVKLATSNDGVNITGIMTASSLVEDSLGNVRTIAQNNVSSQQTLASTDAGRVMKSTSGGLIINTSNGFGLGQAFTFINDSGSDMTITQTGTTLYLTSDGSTGNKTISGRGMATGVCVASNTFYLTGNLAAA